MGHGGDGPPDDRNGETQFGADAVDDAAGKEHHHSISQLKGDDDAAVGQFTPADLHLQVRRQNAKNLAIDIVDGCGKEQQRADIPAQMFDLE